MLYIKIVTRYVWALAVFNYGGSHGVNIVSKDDYDNCNTGNALLSYTGGQNSIPLSSAGDMYFVCPTLNHCDTGMKLAIKVEGTSSATTPATPYGTKSMPHNAASGTFGTMNKMVFGFSLALFVFMGQERGSAIYEFYFLFFMFHFISVYFLVHIFFKE